MSMESQCLMLDYPISRNPRYSAPERPHPELHAILSRHVDHYSEVIDSLFLGKQFLANIPRLPGTIELSADDYESIPNRYRRAFDGDQAAADWFSPIADEVAAQTRPNWLNGFIPGLDGVALYSFIANRKPSSYIEVGSGNSTKFVRQAISDYSLNTRIISIDPTPRAEIDGICDQVVRSSLQDCDLSVFDDLKPGDVVFFDGSHRCLMNSDTAVFFLEILPRMGPELLIGIHDIFLPFDYPVQWAERLYSEQYLLAIYLLSTPERFMIELPSFFCGVHDSLARQLSERWSVLPQVVDPRGTAFWLSTCPALSE